MLVELVNKSRAEGDGVRRVLAGRASPEGGAARLVVGIRVSVRAVALEVLVVGDTGGRAGSRGVVIA